MYFGVLTNIITIISASTECVVSQSLMEVKRRQTIQLKFVHERFFLGSFGFNIAASLLLLLLNGLNVSCGDDGNVIMHFWIMDMVFIPSNPAITTANFMIMIMFSMFTFMFINLHNFCFIVFIHINIDGDIILKVSINQDIDVVYVDSHVIFGMYFEFVQ